MTDPITSARTARESLARGLAALQSPGVPPALMEVAEPIAAAMSALHRIEASGGVAMPEAAPVALDSVRRALALLQAQPVVPELDRAVEAVAGSLSLLHGLAQRAAAPPQPAAPAPQPYAAPAAQPYAAPAAQPYAAPAAQPYAAPAPQPAPAPAPAYQPSPYQQQQPQQVASPYQPPPGAALAAAQVAQAAPPPAAAPPWQQPAPAAPAVDPALGGTVVMGEPTAQQPRPAPQPAGHPGWAAPAPAPGWGAAPAAAPAPQWGGGPTPVQPAPAQQPQAPHPVSPQAQPQAHAAPQPAAYQPAQPARRPEGQGEFIRVEAELGAHSVTNFYKGLSGNDVIDDGGIFIATYQIPPIGQNLIVHVSLPGGYEFEAKAVVRWTREHGGSGDHAPPGYGAQFSDITPEGRQLVYRYVRNREPLFHDDL